MTYHTQERGMVRLTDTDYHKVQVGKVLAGKVLVAVGRENTDLGREMALVGTDLGRDLVLVDTDLVLVDMGREGTEWVHRDWAYVQGLPDMVCTILHSNRTWAFL